jgi:hypothetical protein
MNTPLSVALGNMWQHTPNRYVDVECKSMDILRQNGYGNLHRAILAPAIKYMDDGATLISRCTGRLAVDYGIPESPPAFVRPEDLMLGDKIVVINWVPSNGDATTVRYDTPRELIGRVDKVQWVKCRVAPRKLPADEWITEKITDPIEERRVYAVGLRKGSKISPIIVRDYSLLLRLGDSRLTEPSGEIVPG